MNLRVFNDPKAVAVHAKPAGLTSIAEVDSRDTIVVPAQEDGFEREFLGEKCWYAIRIAGGMLPKIKYIAAYQSAPVSAITYYASVDRIEPYGDGRKYCVMFSKSPSRFAPNPSADATAGSIRDRAIPALKTLIGGEQ